VRFEVHFNTSQKMNTSIQSCESLLQLNEYCQLMAKLAKDHKPGSQDLVFWELNLPAGEIRFDKIAPEVGARINRQSTADSEALVTFLFCLLIGRISSARGNNMWPGVAEELRNLSGVEVSTDRVASFFRDKLGKTFRSELQESPYVFKYVHLCFDQTGIGTDRGKHIRQFFRLLLSIGADLGRDKLFVESAFDRFLQSSSDRGEIDQLRTVLMRTGDALVRLASAFRSGEAAELVGSWDWEKLRNFWLEQEGEDLGRLSPEAREVFEEIFPSIQQAIRQSDLVGYSLKENISIELANGKILSPDLDLSQIAIGWAQVQTTSGVKEILVLSDDGSDPQKIRTYEQNSWHQSAVGLTYTSVETFCVLENDVRYAYGSEYFVGRDFRSQTRAGYLYGRKLNGIRAVEIVETSQRIELVKEERLFIRFHWLSGNTGLILRIRDFSLGVSGYTGVCKLKLSGHTVWEGLLERGRPSGLGKSSLEIDLGDSREEGFTIELFNAESSDLVAATTLNSPLSSDAFLVLRGRIYHLDKLQWLDQSLLSKKGPDGIRLLVTENSGEPYSDSIQFDVFEVSSFKSHPLQYELSYRPGSGNEVSIGLEGEEWRYRLGEPLDVQSLGQTSLRVGSVNLVSEGELELVNNVNNWKLRVVGDLQAREFSLLLRSGRGIRTFESISLEPYIERNGPKVNILDMGRLLRESNIKLETGLVDLQLIGRSTTNRRLSVFLVDSTEINPVGIGERSSLAISYEQGKSLNIDSDSKTRIFEDGSFPLATRRLWVGEGLYLDFFWPPIVRDVCIVLSDHYFELDEPLRLDQLAEGAQLALLGGFANPIIQAKDGTTVKLDSKVLNCIDLIDQNAGLSDQRFSVFDGGTLTRAFELNLEAQVNFSNVVADDSLQTVTVYDLEVFSLNPDSRVLLGTKDHAHSVEYGIAYTLCNKVNAASVESLTFDIIETNSLALDGEIYLVVQDGTYEIARKELGVYLDNFSIQHESEPVNPKTRLKDLLAGARRAPETFVLDELVLILDHAVSRSGTFPVSPTRVLSGLSKVPSSSNNAAIGNCVRLLDSIHAKKLASIDVPVPINMTQASVCLATLLILHELLKSREGLLDYKKFGELMGFMDGVSKDSEHGNLRDWAFHVVRRVSDLVRSSDSIEEIELNDIDSENHFDMKRPLLFVFDKTIEEIGTL
jgi:hypothetical protein